MKEENEGEIKKFLIKLKSLKKDKAALAQVRRGGYRSISVLANVLPIDDWKNKWKKEWYLLIAECWVENPRDGDKFALVCREVNLNEKRFMNLLSSDRDELCQRLRSVLRIIASKRCGVNWFELLNDVLFWGEKTQQQWAGDFWKTRKGKEK
jgi:CRISPR type I-E-associated protein CasB/Cse2